MHCKSSANLDDIAENPGVLKKQPPAERSTSSSTPLAMARACWLATTLLILPAPSIAAALRDCGRLASFAVVQDGGTNFEAVVRVARWQPDKTVSLDFAGNAVRLRPESVSGGATLLPSEPAGAAATSATIYTFRLDPRLASSTSAANANPPGTFRFRADGMPSQPAVRCDLSERLDAFPPAPPPPPPACLASFMWRNGRKWNGGFESFVDVGGAGVPPGFVVRVDFGRLLGLEVLAAERATVLSMEGALLLLQPALGGSGKGAITLRVRGGGGSGPGSPRIQCVEAPAAPPPPPAQCALGAEWETAAADVSKGQGGKWAGTVTMDQWVSGTLVTIDLGDGSEPLSTSTAASMYPTTPEQRAKGIATVELLSRGAGGAKASFKLMYAAPKRVDSPFISCSWQAPPSPPHPPPYPPWPAMAPLRDCALGAAFIPIKAFGKSYSADVALHGWSEGTILLLRYDRTAGDGGASAPEATDVTACYGCEVLRSQSSGTRLALRLQGGHALGLHHRGIGFKVEGVSATRAAESASAGGGGGGGGVPQPTAITCDAVVPPPPAPPPPPWCGLRPHYQLLKRDDADHGRNGREQPLMEAEVAFEVWEVHTCSRRALACVGMRRHASASVGMRRHASACIGMHRYASMRMGIFCMHCVGRLGRVRPCSRHVHVSHSSCLFLSCDISTLMPLQRVSLTTHVLATPPSRVLAHTLAGGRGGDDRVGVSPAHSLCVVRQADALHRLLLHIRAARPRHAADAS